MTLDAAGSDCYNAPCTYAFEVACPGKPANVTKAGAGASAVVTTGAGGSYDINMLDLPKGLNCTVHLTVTDANASSASASAELEVCAIAQGFTARPILQKS